MTYEEIEYSPEQFIIKATDETGKELFIPKDPANVDYQRYLKSLEENTNGNN